MTKVHIVLTPEELQLVGTALSALPYRQVKGLIDNIEAQIADSLKPAEEVPAA